MTNHEVLIRALSPDRMKKILGANAQRYLKSWMPWELTIQGHKYWENFYDEVYPLSKNAKAYLKMLVKDLKLYLDEEDYFGE